MGRSKTDAEARTVYLTPAAVAALGAIRPAGAHGSTAVFGLSAPSISRRGRGGRPGGGLFRSFGPRGHGAAHEIMAQGRWKTARMVEVYTRAEEAGRAAKWLA